MKRQREKSRPDHLNLLKIFAKPITLVPKSLEDTTANADDKLSQQDTTDLLREAINDLEESDRAFLDLLYYQEMPYESIADLMGKSIEALYMQKKRLIDKLKKTLKNHVSS